MVVGGAGPGSMAALIVAERGAAVTLLERMEKPGKKILVCGNGRYSDITANASQDPARFHGPPEFTDAILKAFPVKETVKFLIHIGLPCVEEEMGDVPVAARRRRC